MTDQLLQDDYDKLVVMVQAETLELVELTGTLDAALNERNIAEVAWALQEIRRITANMEHHIVLIFKLAYRAGARTEDE